MQLALGYGEMQGMWTGPQQHGEILDMVDNKNANQADGSAIDPDPILIKKYSNRRLYDTRQSRYITLEDLARIVTDGADVRVVDAKSDADLTRQVLTQVILEQQDRLDLIPIELLHTIIRVQGTLQQGPFSSFLSGFTRQFTHAGHKWAQQMHSLFGSFGMPDFNRETQTAPAGPPPPDPGATQSSDAEDEFPQRMNALLQRLRRDS